MCKINYNESPIGTAGVDAFDLGAAATDTSGQVSSIASNCKISGSYNFVIFRSKGEYKLLKVALSIPGNTGQL